MNVNDYLSSKMLVTLVCKMLQRLGIFPISGSPLASSLHNNESCDVRFLTSGPIPCILDEVNRCFLLETTGLL